MKEKIVIFILGAVAILLAVIIFGQPLSLLETTETIEQTNQYAVLGIMSNYNEVGHRITLEDKYIKSVSFKLSLHNNPTGTAYFNIRWGENKTIIRHDTVDVATLKNGWNEHIFDPPVYVNGDVILSIEYNVAHDKIFTYGAYPGTIDGYAARKVPGHQWQYIKSWDMLIKIVLINEEKNTPPDKPSNPKTVMISDNTFRLQIDISDDDGDTLDVSFYGDNTLIETLTNIEGEKTVTSTWNNVQVGNHTWYVSVTDGKDVTKSDLFTFSYEETQEPTEGEIEIPTEIQPIEKTSGFEIICLLFAIVFALMIFKKQLR